MKRFMLFGVCLMATSSFASAQEEATLKWLGRLIDSGRDYYTIDTKQMTDDEFEAFFRSERFEKVMRRNEGGGDVTLGYGDLGLTFGGQNQSEDAWSVWEQNRLKSGWDFKTRTSTVIRVSTVNREFITMLPDIIRAAVPPPTHEDELSMKVEADENVVLLRLHWEPQIVTPPGEPAQVVSVRVTNVEVAGADLSETARDALTRDSVKQEDQTFRIPWNEGAEFATVLMRSDHGHVLAGYIKRPRAREALLRVKFHRATEWRDVERVSDSFQTRRGTKEHRRGNTGDDDWNKEGWPSFDGFLATETRSVLMCGPGQRLIDVKVDPPRRPFNSVRADYDSPTDTLRKVARNVRTHGPNGSFTLSAMLQEQVKLYGSEEELIAFTGDEVRCSLAKNVVEATLITQVAGKMVWVQIGEERGQGFRLQSKTERSAGGIVDYVYQLVELD